MRSIAPTYEDESKLLDKETYVFKDSGNVTYLTNYPNVVSKNVSGHTSSATSEPFDTYIPNFNACYYSHGENDGHNGKIGNYFAGFTKNASYVKEMVINGNIPILRQPNFASISPYTNNNLKKLGQDEEFVGIDTTKKVHTSGTENLIRFGDIKERWVNPWLRAITVDRRYDYDFTIIGPVIGENFKLYEDNPEKERVWKSLRISGYTYNGIEMSYDGEYEIISAHTDEYATDYDGERVKQLGDDIESAKIIEQKPNKRLEYSYDFSDLDEDCTIYYNHEPNTVWGKFHDIVYKDNHFGYDSGKTYDKDDEYTQLIKESYSNTFAGFDLRNFYWSSYNKVRLDAYANEGTLNSQQGGKGNAGLHNLANPFYVFEYPNYFDTSYYNGDFNRQDVISGKVYPTKRFLDIANIEPAMTYSFENISCSYSMKSSNSSDGTVRSTVEPNEGVSFSVEFSPTITFVPPNASNEEYGNVIYVITEGGGCNSWTRFDSDVANLTFKYNLKEASGFDVFTKVPRVIKVLPYKDAIEPKDLDDNDNISFIKKVNPGLEKGKPEFDGEHCDEVMYLDTAIEHSTLWTFQNSSNTYWDAKNGSDVILPKDVKMKEGYKTKLGQEVSGNFFWKDNKPLNSADNDFGNIIFMKEGINLHKRTDWDVQAFTFLVDREYRNTSDDGLTKHLRVIEFSDLYDTRFLELRTIMYNVSGEMASYVEYKKLGDVSVEVEASASSNTQVSDSVTEETPSEEGTNEGGDNGNTEGGENNAKAATRGEGDDGDDGGETNDDGGDDSGDDGGGTNDDNGESNESTEVSVTGSASADSKVYIQTLSFEMRFKKDGHPCEDMHNYYFADYYLMAYIFEFMDNYGNKYFINCSDLLIYPDGDDYMIIQFTVKWTQDMGILNDKKWTNEGTQPVKMAIYAKRPNNFTYKLGNNFFEIGLGAEQDLPENEEEKSLTVFCILGN